MRSFLRNPKKKEGLEPFCPLGKRIIWDTIIQYPTMSSNMVGWKSNIDGDLKWENHLETILQQPMFHYIRVYNLDTKEINFIGYGCVYEQNTAKSLE